MATSAQRQAAFRSKMAAAGMVQCNVWVPAGCVAEINRAAEIMRERPEYRVARLVNSDTGILCGLKNGPKPATLG